MDASAEQGTTAKFTIAAEGTGLSYQWQIKLANEGAAWKNIGSGKASVSASATAERDGSQIRCIVTDANGNTLTSDTATLTVTIALSITKQPADAAAVLGGTAKFTVAATGAGLIYQWQIKTANEGAAWKNIGSGKATVSAAATAERDGSQIRCIVTDANGNTAISDIATLTVIGALSITKQPVDASAALGGTAKFTIAATGAGLSYQWQIKTAEAGAVWKNIGSGKASVSASATAARDGSQIRCIVTDANGNTVISDTATLTVK